LKDNTASLFGVLNNNDIDPKLMIHDIPPQVYLNAGFIMARGERFWNWWDELNHRMYFNGYRFGEQDTYNLIFHYGDIKGKILDYDYSPYLHGLIHKGKWDKFTMRGKEIILPKEFVGGDNAVDKVISLIHWAGGQLPKMNFHTFFQPGVVKRLQELISDRR